MQVKRVKSYSVSAEDKPGELARIMEIYRTRDVRLLAIWGFGLGSGRSWVVVVPENPRLFKDVSMRAGVELEEGACFYVSGKDEGGMVTDLLARIAREGINVQAVDAIAVGKGFGSYVYTEVSDVEKLGGILNA